MPEIESKYRLCSQKDFEHLIEFLGPDTRPEKLENFYFDTRDELMMRGRRMLRLRKGREWVVTLKGPARRDAAMFEREEVEFVVGPGVAQGMLQEGRADGVLRRLGLEPGPVHMVAHSRVLRYVMRMEGVEIALDHVVLDDGYEYFELEVEGETVSTVEQQTAKLLRSSGVCAEPSVESKYGIALQHA